MRLIWNQFTLLFPVLTLPFASAASSWGFTDATVSVTSKGQGVGGGLKEKLSENKPLSKTIEFGASNTLKVLLTAQEGKSAKRPHQVYLSMLDPTTGLETLYPLSVKDNGKGKVEITQKDIPSQLLASTKPLSISLIVASFGSSKPYNSKAFDLTIQSDPNVTPQQPDKALRYGKLPEIHHIFKTDPKSPPKIISLFFTVVVLAALPALFFGWTLLGGNLNHLSKAFSDSPISHGLYFGSIVAMEGLFFMYYTSWNLFQVLPVATGVGMMIFLTGSRALTEVQERRLGGMR